MFLARILPRRTITTWEPNDPVFWATQGQRIARRNLVFSILAEFAGFSVWQLWSIVATRLPLAGFHLSVAQLFWLTGVPVLVGSLLRLPYGAMVALVGGRTWTAISAALLFLPTLLLALVVQHPHTPFWVLALVAATAGLGGGNFASSMANISYFYPDHKRGFALGVNAAGGNIGVAVVQFVVPWAIGAGLLGLSLAHALATATRTHTTTAAQLQAQGFHLHLANAGLVYLPLIALATLAALLFMDDLTVSRDTLTEQARVLHRRHTWLMSFLYIGTFGSFIGYSSAFPTLAQSQFPGINVLQFAFLGPLVGSLARPLGGWLSDRIGGTVVTLATFVVMGVAALAVVPILAHHDFPLFFLAFMVLFVTSGIGNGSTFQMVYPLFLSDERPAVVAGRVTPEEAVARSRRHAAAAMAVGSAVGALGGFLIPVGFAQSSQATHSPAWAMAGFTLFYVLCAATTVLAYVRGRHETARDHLAEAGLATT